MSEEWGQSHQIRQEWPSFALPCCRGCMTDNASTSPLVAAVHPLSNLLHRQAPYLYQLRRYHNHFEAHRTGTWTLHWHHRQGYQCSLGYDSPNWTMEIRQDASAFTCKGTTCNETVLQTYATRWPLQSPSRRKLTTYTSSTSLHIHRQPIFDLPPSLQYQLAFHGTVR